MDENVLNRIDSAAVSVDAVVNKNSNHSNQTSYSVQPQAQESTPEPEAVEQEESKKTQEQPKDTAEQESFQARNFKELRSFTEKLKAEREALAKENEQLRKYYEQAQRPQQQDHGTQAVESEDWSLPDDEIVEGKHAKQIYKTAKQALEAQKRLQQQMEAMRVEREIEKEMPDYYSVVTPETVSAFRDLDPEMAQVIANYPDLKMQAKTVYKMIQQRGLHKMTEYETPKKLVEQNMKQRPPSTPSVAQSGGESPLGRAMDYYSGDYTEQMKKMYYEQMKKAQMGRI